MRFLRKFNELEVRGIIEDIEDILLEVKDIGFYPYLDEINGGYLDPSIAHINNIKVEQIRINIEHNPSLDDYSDPFHFSDIEDCVHRLIDYMASIGYHDFIYKDIYTDFNSHSKSSKHFPDGEPNILPQSEEIASVVRLIFFR